MTTSPLPFIQHDLGELMTEERAAQYLGTGITARTLRYWRSRKIGPRFVRAGRRVRYFEGHLREWLATQTTEPASATAATAAIA